MISGFRVARRLLWIAIFVGGGSLAAVSAESEEFRPTKFVFLRHAQTRGNATGDYQEPNQKILTAKGVSQTRLLVERLSAYHFDAIISSPRYRVKMTLLPYLESTGQVAEVWTDLDECGDLSTEDDMRHSRDISAKMERRFRLGVGDEIVVSRGADHERACSDRVDEVARRLEERFGGRGLVVLVAGHGDFGRRLLRRMTGEDVSYLDNTSVSEIVEVEMGRFVLAMVRKSR